MPPRSLNILLFAAIFAGMCEYQYRKSQSAMFVSDALNLIENYYIDPIDKTTLLHSAMNGMTSTLDQHSEFIPGEAYENFQDSINQEFAGIGILVEQPEPDRPVRVITPLVGSPALAAGLRPADEIVRVEDEDVSGMKLQEVSKRLKGPIGTVVNVGIRRDEQETTIRIRRATIELESVIGDHRGPGNKWIYRLKEAPEIAYLRLTSFGERTTQEVGRVLRQLDNRFDGLIIDVRGNGGGLLESAVDICDMFLDSGRIVSTKVRGGRIESAYDAAPGKLVADDRPIVVLIDEGSASASEILAACLQDHERAEIVGMRSYGKGTVQNILPLQFGKSALKLTVARYYRPNDHNIHRGADDSEEDEWGVSPKPDFRVELDDSTVERLVQKWRESSYPLLQPDEAGRELSAESDQDEAGAPQPTSAGTHGPSDHATGDPVGRETADGLEIDPQLRRAVDHLRGDKNAASRPSVAA